MIESSPAIGGSIQVELGYRLPDAIQAAQWTNALVERWLKSVREGAEMTGQEAMYRARVVLQINREIRDWDIFEGAPEPGRQSVPRDFIETERHVIAAKKTLLEVVDRLKLDEKWQVTREQALDRVRDGLTVSPVEETALVQIEYLNDDAQMATNVANAVATAYRDRRTDLQATRASNALDTLHRQLKDQADKVEEARLRMLDLAERYRIIDLTAIDGLDKRYAEPVTGIGTILMSSMQDTYQAEANIAQTKMQIETLAGLEGDVLIRTAAMLDIENPIIAEAYPEYQKVMVERQRLIASGLELENPDVQALDEQLRGLRQLLEEGVSAIREMLQTRLAMANKAMELAKSLEENKKDVSMDERRKVAEYSEAQKEYELQKRMFADMQERSAMEQVDLTMPMVPITVHEDAAPVLERSVEVLSWAAPSTGTASLNAMATGIGVGGALWRMVSFGLLAGLLLVVPVMRLCAAVFAT